jgi:ArsR family transcriptional regulator, arsenate/arsenite/antimonite-responsive transcriptional repressor / arsenate reductase (thioredoxin)
VYAALGDPPLAIVDTLTLDDASPGEIATRLGLATNLVAHHVKVPQDAGLVAHPAQTRGPATFTHLDERLSGSIERSSAIDECGR